MEKNETCSQSDNRRIWGLSKKYIGFELWGSIFFLPSNFLLKRNKELLYCMLCDVNQTIKREKCTINVEGDSKAKKSGSLHIRLMG